MAKLKGPLFSLGATAQLGKALVYFPWKGLNVVREYVIPAYSRTTPQATQRDYFKDAVADIHAAMAEDTNPLVEADTTAYGLWASVVQAATTWFNQAVRNWVDVSIDGKTPTVYRGGISQAGVELLHPAIYSDQIDGSAITAGKFYYGTSRTALINSIDATITEGIHQASKEISGLSAGIKYFWQFRPDTGQDCEGAYSGIYHGTPTAA